MSAKRPTRDEAGIAFTGLPWRALSAPQRGGLDAVAALFGGFAPEPVEVRRLAQGPEQPIDGGRGSLFLPRTEMDAVFARSNAWPEALAGVRKAINFLGGDPLQPGIGPPSVDAARATLQSIANEMSAPEMGRGPGGEE
jgi:hypothetical protein